MVNWAPVSVPLYRRLQTFAVLYFVLSFFISLACWVLAAVLLFLPLTTIPMIAYLTYAWLIDQSSQTGRRRTFLRKWGLWRWFRDYFPISLVKTADLDPAQRYVFGYHPHGIISVGALGNFGTDATEFSKEFPGIDLRLCTLPLNFRTPFFREYLLALGMVDSNRRTCDTVLRKGPGSAIMLVVGGAAEALDARPYTMDLTLKRTGFVRVAIDNQACLVPVLSFGENEVFDTVDNPRGSTLRRIQIAMQRWFGFSMPIFHGRGIFNYDFGLLPHRRPITSVVGKPLPPPVIEGLTPEEKDAAVSKYHSQYVTALQELWDTYKDKFSKGRKSSLNIVQ